MRNARRLLAALLAVVMLIPSILVPGYAAETTGFKDVREDSWYADAVDYVSAAGYMKGTSKDAFSPGEDVTRAMFVTILSRVARAQTDNTVSAFGDVAANQYYSGAIEWAAEKEIVNGVGGGLFAPYRSITRQDLAVMLYRFVNAMGYELSAGESRTYTDEAAISAYAADAVRFVTSTGLFAGYQDGSFRPKATATRAQTAVIVMRLAQLLDGQIVDPEPMPAQSFDQTSEQMQVSVNAPEGALPENTEMTVSRVTDEAALAELASKVGAEVLGAADISFAKDGAELEPARKVSVRISLDALQSAKNPAVVHVKDDGSFEYVSSSVVTTRGKADAIEFEADSFSVYAVTDNQTNATLTISFYAQTRGTSGGWEIVNKQIIRANQLGTGKSAIADPGVPNITTSQAFEGWMIEEENVPFNPSFTFDADTAKYSVEQINEYCNGHIPTADKEVVLYAAVYDVVYVTYHDQAGAVTFAEYKKIPADQTSVSVTITEDYPPMKSNQNFSGWVKEDMIDRLGNVDGTLPTYKEGAGASKWPVGSTQNLSENVDLYPYVEEGYWLSFNNNIAKNSEKLGFEDDTSAEYISPKFIPKGTTPTQPAFPSNDPRHGYTFVGWYKDADMTTAFTFNQPLTKDTTVYAKWAFATTSYRVVYWKQRATDNYTYTDSQKNYDYFGSRTVTGAATGSVVGISNSGTNNDTTVNVAQNNENNFYFQFNSSKSDKTVANGSTVKVKGDGTTVLNVYYDRKTITYNFGPAEAHYYQTTPDWNNPPYIYYAQTTGGDYVEVYRVSSGGSYVYYVEYTGTVSTSGSYYMLKNNSFCELVYSSYYGWRIYDGNSYYDTSESDNGKVYTRYTSAPVSTWYEQRYELSSVTYTHSNLYGHLYNESDWPSAGSGNTWSCYDISDGVVYQYPLALTEYVPTWQNQSNPTNSYLTMNFYASEYSTSTIPVEYVGESKTNTSLYNVSLAKGSARKGGDWYPAETIQGFTIKGYAFRSSAPTSSTTWTNCASNSVIPVGASETGTLYVAFTRNNYTLTYSSTNNVGTQTEDVTIPYEKSLTSYKSHTPANSYPGYYFAGWYLDESGTKPFDLETMPARNVIVYAKWNPKWYRIVVDYKRGNSSSVITVPGSTQKASFTVQYGSTIQTSSLMQAQRMDLDGNDNWMLVGLYLDEACNQPFNQNMQAPFGLTEAQEVYPAGSRTGIDDITGETWSDEAYPDVRAKITLYAKWRVNPEGVVGIKVRYLGDHAENDKGYFDSNEKPHSMTLQNPVFTDGAKASAHSATVPALPDEDTPDVGRRFLYWEILDKYGNPTGEIVYPGSPFKIDINKAVEIKTPLPDPNCTHTNEGASTIASVAAIAPTCTGTGVAAHYKCTKCGRLFTDANGANETTLDALTVPATGHDWETNDPTYVWSVSTFDEHTLPTCTATVVCHNDANHVQTETASGTSVSLIVEDGGTTGHYVAHFENELFEDWTSSSFPISRLVVTYQANGETLTGLTETVNPNGTVTLPTAENVPALTGYTFVGWVMNIVSDTTTAPAYKAPGATSDPINAPTTFYALYTREQATGGNTTVYKRLTESPADWTGTYVITSGNTADLHALKTTGTDTYLQNEAGAAALSDSGMTLIDSNTLSGPTNDYLFTVSAVSSTSSYYYIRSSKDNGYVSVYYDSTEESYGLSNLSSTGTNCRWSLSMNGESVVAQNRSYNSYYLAYGLTTDNVFLFAAMTAAPSALYFWKETTVPATATHYTTTIPTYTVTYSVPSGVDQPDPETVVQGESLTLPAAPEGTPSGYTFLGWTTAQTGNATTQPATLTGEYTPVGTVTLYALYSYVQGSGSVEYNLVTAAPADWSGSYVITNNSTTTKYVLKGVTGSASGTNAESDNNCATLAASGITQNGNVLTNVTDAYVFTLTANGSYYTVKSASTGSYYGQNSSSYLFAYSALNGNNTNWTPAINASGAQLKCAANGSYPYFGFSTDNSYFWAASTNNANVLQLWKQTPVGTTYYTTNPGSGGNAVTQPNLSSGKADSSANLINLSANAIPNPNPLGAGDVWVPTTTIDTSKEYLIGISDGSNVYLLANHNGSNYYYTYNSNYRYLYTGTATLDGNNVIGVTGAQTSLDNCKWKFGSSTGGVITNQYNTSNKLHYATSGASSGTTTFYQLYQSSTGNSSTYDSSSNTIRFGSYYLGLVSIGSVDYGCVLSSAPSTSVILYTKATNYTVSYNANASDATGTMADQTLTAGSGTLTANAFTRSGYTFAGWNTAADGTGTAASDRANVKVTANLTLYAQWVKTPGSGDTVTYELAETLTAGEDYVVVIGSYAVGNTTVTGEHYLNAQSVTVNSNDTITVPASAASSVLWHATGTTSGWSFYNPSAVGFIGLSSDYYLSIESNVGRAWTYDNTDLNNNCVDDGNKVTDTSSSYYGSYYYYLSARSPASTGFTTTPSTGNNVKFYKRVITAPAATYTVTVASDITNGSVSASPTTAAAGATITLAVSPNTGYEIGTVTYTPAGGSPVTINPVNGAYSFLMPAVNVTVNATFTASSTPEPGITTIERWVPVDTIADGEDYLIGFVYDGNTYLGLNYSPNTTNHYYYSYKFYTNDIQSSNNTFLGYTGTPIFDGVNITGVEGNTTNLEHAIWTFNTTNGGYYVVSKNNSNRYLYAKKGGSSSSYSSTNSLYWDQYPNTTANVWTWDATNHHLYNTTNSVYAGVFTLSDSVYMSCEATNDSNYTDYIYVQLYKKEIINVYNVTLNPTENGTVRANKSTATAGETVTLILTPNDGYQVASVTVTDSNGATVPVTGTSGIITFTMPASNVTVSATFTNVIPDNVWVVSFVDEDGKDIPGMNDMYVPKANNSLAESALPDPAMEDYYFLGWYQGNVKCTFPMTVNSDIVLTPKYSPMYAYDYTITLRAVYGPYNPDATTHIYWYANNGTDAHNGAGERYTSKYTVTEGGMTTTTTKLPINAHVDIPLPTGNPASQTVFVGDNGGALTWEDHVFLGWARVDNGGTADAAEAQILTPDDIYLKWTGTEYMVREDDGTYSPFSSQKVYADETTPYHDMYAVWAGFYYIYHSSDGTLEAVQVPYDARDTKDLVAEAESKDCLYGGYYKSSGAVIGVDTAEMRAAKDSILNQQNFWNYTDSCVASGSVTETSLKDEGAVEYNGSSLKNGDVRFWNKAQAYTALGTELAPTAGTVYYLKEVPKTFLPNRLVYVKADKDTTFSDGTTTVEKDEVTNLYLMTALDDRNYADNGFIIGKAHSDQNVTSLDGTSGSANSLSRVFIIAIKKGDTYEQHRYNAHDLNEGITVPNGVDADLVGFVAATNLGLEWIRANRGTNDGTATFYLKPYWTTLDGVTVEQDNLMGVNISSNGKSIGSVTFN